MTKSILITGASSGIGYATALEFLNAGWTVGLLARRGDVLEDMANTFDTAVPLPADVTNEADVDAAVAAFVEKTGRLDAMFNNAGISGPQATIDEVSLEQFQNVVDVNLTGMFLAARAAFRQMRAQSPQGGRIINNGSISAHTPRPQMVCYTTTKHAITGMTRQISLDGRPFDIACGQIDIGNAGTAMVTEMNDILVARGDEPNPVMDVKDAARAVLHMAELPLETNVQFMTIIATKMPYIGRG
ncbi:SDR family oxidoreductase [uncultured Boseongicola sp.]|jgi:NAD(P)-dependent dehydrogenase (short-subunit alcohol dehydrogenase family)|uniref:SDR family oxidoreductase n=1 Tax=uncultured Boseongicola sp. TaxID=1648499 RepID=UPI00263051F5|nr:SDR family oxidoreductase [uncultured Boseongicola sp.]